MSDSFLIRKRDSPFLFELTCYVCNMNRSNGAYILTYTGGGSPVVTWCICDECIIDLEKVELMFSLSLL